MPGVVVDTSALLAVFDDSEPDHSVVVEALKSNPGPLIVSPYVVAELDYLVATRHGRAAEKAVLAHLASGAWELPGVGREDLDRIGSVIDRYDDHLIGVADASNVILAARYDTRRIATLDRRHFNILRTTAGDPFEVLPA